MAEAAELEKRQPIPIDERVLTEIDNLSYNRLPDGSYDPQILDDVLLNLTTATQEAAMPYAISKTEHKYRVNPETKKGTFMWLGKTAVEAAMSGYDFHIHEAARKRVDVEVDEAEHAETELRYGMAKVFLSPRMSKKDAKHEIAEQEHLADDDSVRVSWPVVGDNGQIEKRILKSLLVRDVPLEAWVAMLQDPVNIFGRAIKIEYPESALSVMAVHRELEVPFEALPKGPLSLVEAVLPYITDIEAAQKVASHIERYHDDQEDMRRKAESIAERWLAFEVALSESVDSRFANFEIRRFIIGLQRHWGEDDIQIILEHQLPNTEFRMTRELAIVLEKAKRNTLWAPAAVITNNPEVLKQLDPITAERIYNNEMLMQIAWANGQNISALEAQNNRLVASNNIRVGGGCPGVTDPNFGTAKDKDGNAAAGDSLWDTNDENKENWKWKKGVCQVKTCSTRPGQTEVGPCSVCRKCQIKFDKGEDPTKESAHVNKQKTETQRPSLFEAKAHEAAAYKDKELAKEFDTLAEQENRPLAGVY